RTVRAGARTGLRQVAFARRRPTGERRRLEGIVGTRTAAARARLRDVAATRRRSAADGARVARVVDAEGATDGAVAEIGRADVAVVRARRARRLHGVVRTGRARAGAELGVVALVGGRPARGARVARIVDAERAADGAVAEVRRADVAVVGARRPRRLDGVAWTGGAVAWTRLLEVALVGRRAADERRQLERVVGARAAAARARLGHV